MSFAKSFQRHQKTWGLICGVIVTGTVVKIAYFQFARDRYKQHEKRVHERSMANLREAKEYGQSSFEERQKKLPTLTPEEGEQMQRYLQLIQQHGMDKIKKLQSDGTSIENCVGCPAMGMLGRRGAKAAIAKSDEAS